MHFSYIFMALSACALLAGCNSTGTSPDGNSTTFVVGKDKNVPGGLTVDANNTSYFCAGPKDAQSQRKLENAIIKTIVDTKRADIPAAGAASGYNCTVS